MESWQIVMVVLGNSMVGLAISFFGIRHQIAKAKQKHQAEIEKKRIEANLQLEQERMKRETEQKRLAMEAKKPKQCRYCGSESNASASFCDSCGARLFNR